MKNTKGVCGICHKGFTAKGSKWSTIRDRWVREGNTGRVPPWGLVHPRCNEREREKRLAMTFLQWCKGGRRRDDAIGDFAREFLTPGYPKNGGPAQWRIYLEKKEAGEDALRTLETAFKMYRRFIRP